MSSKSFGTILIIVGLLLIVTLFVFSQWNVNHDFIQNIRYAIIYELESRSVVSTEGIRLGHALLLPLVLISTGYLLKKEIISKEFAKKILPFLNNDINH